MNPTKEVRGVDRVVGELLCAVPDIDEFLADLSEIEFNIASRLKELAELRGREKAAVLALEADVRLLDDLIKRGRGDWRARRDQIEAGASDIGLVIPRLGFRIIAELPREPAS